MSMRMSLVVDVSDYLSHKLGVKLSVESDRPLPDFCLEMLQARPGFRLENFVVLNRDGQSGTFTIRENRLSLTTQTLEIRYSVHIEYAACVGIDRDVDLNYPFVNAQEIFFSTGIFPFPFDLQDRAKDMHLDFVVMGVPAGWQVFSSLTAGNLNPAKLDNFFWYVSSTQEPESIRIRGRAQDTLFRILTQRGKRIPIAPTEFEQFLKSYFVWLEETIASYRQLDEINFLILQAPNDFSELVQKRTFATGENIINGIVVYGPDDPKNYRMFGSDTYRDFLLLGLAHEVMHFYTTTAPQGKYKSVLYPTVDCPPAHANLIGEGLNLYLVLQFFSIYFEDPTRLQRHLLALLQKQGKSSRRVGMLDLFLLDQALKQTGTDLLALFSALIKSKQEQPGPYASGAILFEVLRERMAITVPVEIEQLILANDVPDYKNLCQTLIQP